MCNVNNSIGSGCCGYSASLANETSSNHTGGCCGLFGFGQRLCRDCNGNVWVIYDRNPCCPCCCHCGCHCGSGNTDSNDNQTASGTTNVGYGCVTVCGMTANGVSSDEYYARQYALNGRSNRSCCRCGGISTF